MRKAGREPRCLGVKQLLPSNTVITVEDAVPPPPDDSKYFFIGIGVSVYNKEMLDKKRLPLVNGFSQLMISVGEELDEAKTTAAKRSEADAGGAAAAVGKAGQRQQPKQGSAVPATLSQRSGVSTGDGGGREADGGGGKVQMEALMGYAVGRVKKQVEITKQVAEELTKLTPGKLQEAAVVQAKKVQEMPTLLFDTSKRMVGSSAKLIRKHLDEQERKRRK
eukprot:g14245.t1